MAEYVCLIVPAIDADTGVIQADFIRRERIVRCRDCKNYRPAEDDEHEDGCALAYAYLFDTSPDGFCAWASERDQNE